MIWMLWGRSPLLTRVISTWAPTGTVTTRCPLSAPLKLRPPFAGVCPATREGGLEGRDAGGRPCCDEGYKEDPHPPVQRRTKWPTHDNSPLISVPGRASCQSRLRSFLVS